MRAVPVSLASIGIAALFGVAGLAGTSRDQPPARRVVVAELFTSEGCSSCPPADALLQRIAGQSPVPGVEVIALEEHVDYWDNLGWRDPFSSPAYTKRQSDYDGRVFRSGEIYTPQIVIDGAYQSVGSDEGGVRSAIAHAAARPAADVRVRATIADGRAHAEIAVAAPDSLQRRKDADIYVALVEDGLTTKVDRGENRGRTLPHYAVVRTLAVVGVLPPSAPGAAAAADIPLDRGWQPSRLRVIAFVQDRDTRRVLGSTASNLDREPHVREVGLQAPEKQASPAEPPAKDSHVEIKTSASGKTVSPGVAFNLVVDVKPAGGVHVYAPGVVGYKPIALHLDPQPGLTAGPAQFPASEDLYLAGTGEHVPVFQKPFHIMQPVTIDHTAGNVRALAPGNQRTVTGRLEYQACTDTVCFMPQTVHVSWTVTVAGK